MAFVKEKKEEERRLIHEIKASDAKEARNAKATAFRTTALSALSDLENVG